MSRGLDRYEGAALTLTAAYNVAVNRHLPRASHVPANLGASAVLLLLASRGGVDVAGLGLAPDAASRGVRVGAAAAASAMAGVAIGAAVPATRSFFVDARIGDHSRAELAYHALVRIPMATALSEELVFRGALLGLFGRGRSRTAAVTISSVLFGLWHVLPALDSATRGVGPTHRSRARRAASVAGVVGMTAAAGLVFARLRTRSGSVVAPALAHAALNGAAFVAAHRISRA